MVGSNPPKISISMPVHNSIPSKCFVNFFNFFIKSAQKYQLYTAFVDSPIITDSRNTLVENFLKTDADYLWFLDSDMLLTNNTLDELINSDKEVVSGLYFQRTSNLCWPVYRMKNGPIYESQKNFPVNQLFEVDVVGLGCLLIKRKVIEDLDNTLDGKGPFFDIKYINRNALVGEDIYFCELIKNEGYKIFVNSKVMLGHFGGIIDAQYFISKNNVTKEEFDSWKNTATKLS